jgi:CubicO group peptidase (beta-lactamase class C family)
LSEAAAVAERGPIEREMEAAIAGGAFPGAVLRVSRGSEAVYHAAFGARSVDPEVTPMRPDTIFDLSSLTKPLATTTAIMILLREGKLRLDDRVTRFLPNFGVHGKIHVTIRSLLAHCSGLAGWRPFHKDIARMEAEGRVSFLASRGAKEWVYEQVQREKPEYPTGQKSVYSDLGFILLGAVVELLAQMPLDRFVHERVVRPLGLRSTAFVDLTHLRSRRIAPVTDVIAPTERCPWRGRLLCGEVHDDNAWAMGGVAGHAGLFANAADVDTLAGRLVDCLRGRDDFVPQALVREFWTRDATVAESTWALGWDTPSPGTSSAGTRMSRQAVGHLGFTGTSLWIDLDRDLRVTLLTNRTHPRRDNERIREARPRIHDAVVEAFGA